MKCHLFVYLCIVVVFWGSLRLQMNNKKCRMFVYLRLMELHHLRDVTSMFHCSQLCGTRYINNGIDNTRHRNHPPGRFFLQLYTCSNMNFIFHTKKRENPSQLTFIFLKMFKTTSQLCVCVYFKDGSHAHVYIVYIVYIHRPAGKCWRYRKMQL